MSDCKNEFTNEKVVISIFRGCNNNVKPADNLFERLGSRQSFSISIDGNAINTYADDSGGFDSAIMGKKSGSMDLGGVYRKDDAANVKATELWYSSEETGDCWIRTIQPSKDGGTSLVRYIRALTTNFSIDGGAEAAVTYSMTAQTTSVGGVNPIEIVEV